MRTADPPIRISLIAPDGRMGKAIAAAVADDPGFALDQDHGDVLVDFSAPDALQKSSGTKGDTFVARAPLACIHARRSAGVRR